jgi:hypothetical protein
MNLTIFIVDTKKFIETFKTQSDLGQSDRQVRSIDKSTLRKPTLLLISYNQKVYPQ